MKKQLSIFEQIPVSNKSQLSLTKLIESGSRKKKVGRPRLFQPNTFGGIQFKNYNPREQRPLKSNQALHLILRSSLAVGVRSFRTPKNEEKIWEIIERHAEKNGITIYEYANAGNHLHLLIRAKRRDFYNRFIRSITGLIARAVMSSEKGSPLKKGRFWDARPFTRIVQFAGNDFKKVKLYIARNRFEALGFIDYIPRSAKKNSDWKWFCENYVCFRV
ncbi:MAG: transposase [Bdellovibrionales bacterium]|nr:transposase [Bdellovibrionales bacterium]